MAAITWEIACPACGEGAVRVRESLSRAAVDAMLPDSMRATPVGSRAAAIRDVDGVTGCAECGLDPDGVAGRVAAEGLPKGARDISAESGGD